MDYLKYSKNIKKAVDYIEKNLKNEVTYAGAAKAAGMSKDNFWRVFKKIFKDTVTNYIRGRRMTLIARRLVRTKDPISRIFTEYGYESHEAITRAFKRRFKMTPVEYRRKGEDLYFLEVHKLKGGDIKHLLGDGLTLEPRKVKIKRFGIYGVTGMVLYKNALPDSIKMLKGFFSGRARKKVLSADKIYALVRADGRRKISDFFETSRIEVTYGIKSGEKFNGLKRKNIPGGVYAHFLHKGKPDLLNTSYDYIFGNWLRAKKKFKDPRFFFESAENRMHSGNSINVNIFVPLNTA